ncbi:MAG: selenocysteine-specific translation elongation factor [Phycisphaeraceae bacterium]|nr:selenocysteine-specific translation elongation factor [Phycisphaeraceae bacterium]
MDRPTVILGTAGHIDHGKTALVRALTGIDTDRLPEEQARGITIDIGFARLDLPGVQVAIVDVPGHERFVRNMLAGASGIDVALLVVAADDSIMPQTREHLAVLRLLGVSSGLIAITKCDLVDHTWASMVEDEIRALVAGTFLEGQPMIRTSATTGLGIATLAEAIESQCGGVRRGRSGEPFRVAIDRAFLVRGVGTVVTGTVWSGTISRDSEVEWLPPGRTLRVKGLQVHGESVDRVDRGERAALSLVGVHHSEIRRGHELAEPGALASTRLLSVRLESLEGSPWALRHRARLRLHLGTTEVGASLRLLADSAIEPGSTGLAQLVCAEPVVARVGQAFVVRSESPVVTLGGGRVLQALARPIRRRDAASLRWLEQIESQDAMARAGAAIALMGTRPWAAHDLWREAGADRDSTRELLGRLREAGETLELSSGESSIQLHRAVVAEIEARIVRVLERRHQAEPDRVAQPRERIETDLGYLSPDVLNALLQRLVGAGRVREDPAGLALAQFQVPGADAAAQRSRRAVACIDQGGFSPPSTEEIATDLAMREADVRAALTSAARAGEVVHIGGGWHLSASNARELEARVLMLLAEKGSLTVSQIRDALATTRKYAVPLCEYLDRIGITRRRGDSRIAGPRAVPGSHAEVRKSS